jgi:carbamoyltransferase
MNYIGINLSHDASITIVDGTGKIDTHLSEERLSRIKKDGWPSKVFEFLSHKFFEYDNYCFCSLSYYSKKYQHIVDDMWAFYRNVITKVMTNKIGYNNSNQLTNMMSISDKHHILHACTGFYNSGFDKAVVIVVDGLGNETTTGFGNLDDHEFESVYIVEYPDKFNLIHCGTSLKYSTISKNNSEHHGEWDMGIGMAYPAVASHLGLGSQNSGKLMGLSSYGEYDPNIKSFLNLDGTINSKLFYKSTFGANLIPYDYIDFGANDASIWMNNKNKFKIAANLAYRMQKDFESYMSNLILKSYQFTGIKKIVLSGGCALNCVANYEYLNILPKDVELYIEPMCGDEGTSLGYAQFTYHSNI